jgi:hypothetical protein
MKIEYNGIIIKVRKLKSGVIDITIDVPEDQLINIDTNSKNSNQNGNSIYLSDS